MLRTDLLTFGVAVAVFRIAGGMRWLPAYFDNRVQCDKILSKFGQQQLVMASYACGFNQSETGKYFE